ncbi:PH domain-containing protein [Ectobacillus ponti]|uniref:PH domain-containing protein n=1 Tax=Ectobacillus ponti TaxID=2961894 RepID=A0AA41X681_9BACI|nr:PH domain-containing protein [Ectobacillus ponti]MCP8969542.1 PH domain-containing protein [Ectobacillus ponti]
MKFAIQRSRAITGSIAGLTAIGVLLFILGIEESGFFAFVSLVLGFVIAVAGGGLYWASTRSCLEVTNEHLIHHIGPLPLRVTLDRIRTVDIVEGSTIAAAWTMTRVQVMLYPHEIFEVSMPLDPAAFMRELQGRCPHAKVRYEHPEAQGE